jgi:hypothetical protein
VAPGDQFCVLIGCSVPVILRRVPEIEREEYMLVGESYIHGMMEREAMDKLDRAQYKLERLPLCDGIKYPTTLIL